MNREQVIATLREHETELKRAGVARVSLFGSVARGEAGPDSDVDVAVELDESFSSGGFDYFGQLDELERRLAGILGREVDVVPEPARKERLQAEINRDRVLAF